MQKAGEQSEGSAGGGGTVAEGLQHIGVMNGMVVGPPGDERCPEKPYVGHVVVLGAEMGLFLLPLLPLALILFRVTAEECLTLQPTVYIARK